MKTATSFIPRVTFRVVNPETGALVDAAEWLNQSKEIRQTAEWISFETDRGDQFLMHKLSLPDDTWAKQQEAVKKIHPEGRCGTRYEFMLIQYARENSEINLDDLLVSIGGDDLNDWFWTEEKVQSYATYAWSCSGTGGYLGAGHARVDSNASRVLRAL